MREYAGAGFKHVTGLLDQKHIPETEHMYRTAMYHSLM